MNNLEYTFSGELAIWRGQKSKWFLMVLPRDISDHARYFTSHVQRGFKSLKVDAQIGDSQWRTSLFPSKERQSYLLFVKKSVREAQNIKNEGDTAEVTITILDM